MRVLIFVILIFFLRDVVASNEIIKNKPEYYSKCANNSIGEERIDVRSFGAVADYDPDTGIGTDLYPAYLRAKASGKPIFLARGKYKLTNTMSVYTGMDWLGEPGAEIYTAFSSSGRMVFGPPEQSASDISLKEITIVRRGAFAEHGMILDAIECADIDVKVFGDPRTLTDGISRGGAIGISPFYPQNRPSKNVKVKAYVTYGGNFGVQFGNVQNGDIEVDSVNTHREVIGVEPYALGKHDFNEARSSAITWNDHDLEVGWPLIYSEQNNPSISGLKHGNYYFAVPVDKNTLRLALSREQAHAGNFVSFVHEVGTYRIYKAGFAQNITARGTSVVGDVELNRHNSLTGEIIVTATSGGYHENVVLSDIKSTSFNRISGSANVSVYGAHGVTIENCDIVGAETVGIDIRKGFLQGIRDTTGNIDPSKPLPLLADVIVKGNRIKGFAIDGIKMIEGRAHIEGNFISSREVWARGINISISSSSPTLIFGNQIFMPFGTEYFLQRR